MQIKIKDMQNFFPIDVQPTDTIKNIKDKIKFLKSYPIENQILYYGEIELKDYKNIKDYSIPNEEILYLIINNSLSFKILFIKPVIGKEFPLKVNTSSNIRDIKDEIEYIKKIPANSQKLFYKSQCLDDSIQISNSQIPTHSVLFLRHIQKDPIEIIINYIQESKTKKLIVEATNLIEDIKYEMHEYPSELIFAGITLKDYLTISDYLIPNNSILDYLTYKRNGIIIFIKTINGTFIPIEILPNDKIEYIKEYIRKIEGIKPDQQFLFFEDKKLEDEKQIQNYSIYSEATIELHLSDQKINIFIKNPSEEPFLLEVYSNSKIEYIKSLIESKTGIKINNQRLIFQKKQLENNFFIQNYSIINNSTLILVPLLIKSMQITVKTESGDSFILIAKPTDLIKDFKIKIIEKKKNEFPIEKVNLFFENQKLEDENSFQFYLITNDTIINLLLVEKDEFVIFIDFAFHDFIPIKVKHTTSIEYIKNKIQEKKGVPIDEQILFVGSSYNEIVNDRKVQDYSLSKGQIISFIHFIKNGFRIFIKLLTSDYIKVYVLPTYKTEDIKNIIYKKKGISVDSQRLVFAGKQFEDGHTIESYYVKKDSTIHLLLKMR